jgi:hypothetical protein
MKNCLPEGLWTCELNWVKFSYVQKKILRSKKLNILNDPTKDTLELRTDIKLKTYQSTFICTICIYSCIHFPCIPYLLSWFSILIGNLCKKQISYVKMNPLWSKCLHTRTQHIISYGIKYTYALVCHHLNFLSFFSHARSLK